MKEGQWTRKVCASLKKCNAVIFACVAQAMQEPGWPDRWICHRRWRGWLEFKGVNTRLSAIQRKKIDDLNARQPGSAYVVRQPGIVEDTKGNELARFTTAVELLKILEELTNEASS